MLERADKSEVIDLNMLALPLYSVKGTAGICSERDEPLILTPRESEFTRISPSTDDQEEQSSMTQGRAGSLSRPLYGRGGLRGGVPFFPLPQIEDKCIFGLRSYCIFSLRSPGGFCFAVMRFPGKERLAKAVYLRYLGRST